MHWMTASLPPEMVTARSVLLGNISLATWTLAPVTSRISLILLPPFPMRLPHWLAGTTSLKVMGGRGTVPGEIRLLRSWHNNFYSLTPPSSASYLVEFVAYQCKCLENWFRISSDGDDSLRTGSVTDVNFRPALYICIVKIRKCFINCFLTSSRNLFTMSPFFPIILPTSWKLLFQIIPIWGTLFISELFLF